jgi:hypothetical protein
VRLNALRVQRDKIVIARELPAVDAQAQHRPRIARVEHRGGTLRMLGEHPVDPPARIGKARLGIDRDLCEQRVTAAEKGAQDRVDQTLRRCALELRRRAHGGVDDRMRRRAGVDQLVERNPKQRFDTGVGQPTLGKRMHDRARFAQEAQRAVRELVRQRAITRWQGQARQYRRKRIAGKDATDDFRGGPLRTLHRGARG